MTAPPAPDLPHLLLSCPDCGQAVLHRLLPVVYSQWRERQVRRQWLRRALVGARGREGGG